MTPDDFIYGKRSDPGFLTLIRDKTMIEKMYSLFMSKKVQEIPFVKATKTLEEFVLKNPLRPKEKALTD
jgi:hypothetical protein